MEVIQLESERGSQKWLQRGVNQSPAKLNSPILKYLEGASNISWFSPLSERRFTEYRDADFLKQIGVEHLWPELQKFWPARGPQWDGLARSDCGDVLLVEAKAHIGELCSPVTKAGPSSRLTIENALRETSTFLHAKPCAPWSEAFYQLTN
jgi:hypothetical protein